jgi:HPt (histidine-containing phosphotransfer) domain-containing protein
LDPGALAELSALDPQGSSQLLQRVLSTYNGSLLRLMQQLRQGRASGDLAAIRLAAHTLKSSSASVGAKQLAQQCAAIEQAIRLHKLEELPSWLSRLELESQAVALAVQDLLGATAPPRT